METLRSKSDEKKMVWSGYGHKALKIVRTKFRGRLVRMRSPVQIQIAAPKILENFGFRGFFVAKSCFAVWVKVVSRNFRKMVGSVKEFSQNGLQGLA